MKQMWAFAAVLATMGFWSGGAEAALNVGDPAPDFTAKAAVGGKVFDFHLADALKKGPVVLYFFPKAFTAGCTQEAHDFADAAESYTAAGATLIGMSADSIEKETEFTSKECRDRFPVAADPDLAVIKSYQVVMMNMPGMGVSNRTSYVIAPDGKILFVYDSMSPDQHVEKTLTAVKAWRQDHPQ